LKLVGADHVELLIATKHSEESDRPWQIRVKIERSESDSKQMKWRSLGNLGNSPGRPGKLFDVAGNLKK
jgi:hypothetical protein